MDQSEQSISEATFSDKASWPWLLYELEELLKRCKPEISINGGANTVSEDKIQAICTGMVRSFGLDEDCELRAFIFGQLLEIGRHDFELLKQMNRQVIIACQTLEQNKNKILERVTFNGEENASERMKDVKRYVFNKGMAFCAFEAKTLVRLAKAAEVRNIRFNLIVEPPSQDRDRIKASSEKEDLQRWRVKFIVQRERPQKPKIVHPKRVRATKDFDSARPVDTAKIEPDPTAARQLLQAEIVMAQAEIAGLQEQLLDMQIRHEALLQDYESLPIAVDDALTLAEPQIEQLEDLYDSFDALYAAARDLGVSPKITPRKGVRLQDLSEDLEPLPLPAPLEIAAAVAAPEYPDLKVFERFEDPGVREAIAQLKHLRGNARKLAEEMSQTDAWNDAADKLLLPYRSRAEALIGVERQFQKELGLFSTANAALAAQIESHQSANGKPKAAQPQLNMLADWAKANLKGRVVIHPRAMEFASQHFHRKPQWIFNGLLLLAHEFWDEKMSGGKSDAERNSIRQEFARRAQDLCTSIGGSITNTQSRRAMLSYNVTLDGKSYFLDQHLARSTSRDKSRHVRIYFTWDDVRKQVIVGHLPTHQENNLA